MKPRYNMHVNAIISAKTIHVGLGSPVFLFLFGVFLKVVILCGCIPKHSNLGSLLIYGSKMRTKSQQGAAVLARKIRRMQACHSSLLFDELYRLLDLGPAHVKNQHHFFTHVITSRFHVREITL